VSKAGTITGGNWDGPNTRVNTVWCGRCEEWDAGSSSKRVATRQFRESGWTKIKGRWHCPQCSAALDESHLNEANIPAEPPPVGSGDGSNNETI